MINEIHNHLHLLFEFYTMDETFNWNFCKAVNIILSDKSLHS